jgi:chemotaxis family two-component system sensor kinase Cph1
MPNAPFGDCKSAELQLLNRVQSIGGLVAIDKRTQLICACSANIHAFTGRRPEELLGRSWTSLFRTDQVSSLFKPQSAPGLHVAQILKSELNGQAMLVANHSLNNTTLVEIEPADAESQHYEFADRVVYLEALGGTDTAEDAARLLMQKIAGISHYDRVMLYRFMPDWHGEVIAESLAPGMVGFIGLRFPATDLPASARRLYLMNWQRIIADVRSDSVAIIAAADAEPLDLTFSQLRAVHPVHIQYLKNIGVEASFSVSVVVAGRLWGLIACHHLTAKRLSLIQRQLCEELARTAAIHMTDMHAMQLEKARAALRESLAAILGALGSQEGNKRAIISQLTPIREAFRAEGILARFDDEDFHGGQIPDEISLSALRNWLEIYDKAEIAASTTISPSLAKYPALVRFASGILYIPLADRDFLVLTRPEQIETVHWAGKPQGATDTGESIAELTPRASFQAWSEQVRGSSERWTQAELESAAKLRELLIEYIDMLRLEAMALHDPLTGLGNRAMFRKAIQNAIRLAIKDKTLSAVFVLDLDEFKPVNDTLGHAAGDEVLVEVGNRLTAVMRSRDAVARLGGDEFAVLQVDLRRAQDAEVTAERILKEIRRPFSIGGRSVEIGVSIGVSICPINAVEHDELLEDADLALYHAKRAGRNTFKSFTDTMVSDKDQKESGREALLDAMQNGRMWVAYQPIISAKTKGLYSFESFARWRHPDRGELTAREFLPIIDQNHLLNQFAEWSIRQVLQQGKLWMRKGLPLVPVSVNISSAQFFSMDLVGLCTALSGELEIGLEWLRFDLDEMALQADFLRAATKMRALSACGILTNIDHFGQGLVALNQIVDVKINQFKVAGSYFQSGKDRIRNDAMIAIIHSIGKVMNIPIVATQLETDVMEMRARATDMDYLQGYHISLALAPDAAEVWLRNRVDTLQAIT